jgi:hypothetical protein
MNDIEMQIEMPLNTTNKNTRHMKMRSLVLRSLVNNIETIATNNIFDSFIHSNKVFPETIKNINKVEPMDDELDEMESQHICYYNLSCRENKRLLEQEKKKREQNKYMNVFFS